MYNFYLFYVSFMLNAFNKMIRSRSSMSDIILGEYDQVMEILCLYVSKSYDVLAVFNYPLSLSHYLALSLSWQIFIDILVHLTTLLFSNCWSYSLCWRLSSIGIMFTHTRNIFMDQDYYDLPNISQCERVTILRGIFSLFENIATFLIFLNV